MLSRKCNSVTPNDLISHPLDRMDLILLSLPVCQSYFIAQLELRLHPVILSVPEERMVKYSRDHWYFRLDWEIMCKPLGDWSLVLPLVLCGHCKLQIQISPVWLDRIFNWMQDKKKYLEKHISWFQSPSAGSQTASLIYLACFPCSFAIDGALHLEFGQIPSKTEMCNGRKGYSSNHSFTDLYTAGTSVNWLFGASSPRHQESRCQGAKHPHSLGFCANTSLSMQGWKNGKGGGKKGRFWRKQQQSLLLKQIRGNVLANET